MKVLGEPGHLPLPTNSLHIRFRHPTELKVTRHAGHCGLSTMRVRVSLRGRWLTGIVIHQKNNRSNYVKKHADGNATCIPVGAEHSYEEGVKEQYHCKRPAPPANGHSAPQ